MGLGGGGEAEYILVLAVLHDPLTWLLRAATAEAHGSVAIILIGFAAPGSAIPARPAADPSDPC